MLAIENTEACFAFILLGGGGMILMAGILWLKTARLAKFFGVDANPHKAFWVIGPGAFMFALGLLYLGQVAVAAGVGGLALLGMIVAILRARPAAASKCDAGQRLLVHSRQRSDYRLLVGVPALNPRSWVEVEWMGERSVGLRNAQILQLDEVKAYLVAYPSGIVADCQRPDELPMPSWVKFPDKASNATETAALGLKADQSRGLKELK